MAKKTFLENFYNVSPPWVQELMLNGYALRLHRQRFGKKFLTLLDYLNKSQWLSNSDLIELQNEKLRHLIKHAYETVPYYQWRMRERKLGPDDIKTVDDLVKLPLLTREDVRTNLEKLISQKYSKRQLVGGHTSGTTGSPLQFYWDKDTCLMNNAVDWRQKNWAGLQYGDRYAVLLGRTIVPTRQKKPPFWRMNYIHNQLWLSSFHMSEENLAFYIKKLEDFKPVALEGYPSTLFILAKYLESRNRVFPLRAVLTSSETLHSIQRETIERQFCCRVFDFYGLAERTIFATECERHEGHHINMEYGIVEVVDDRGDPMPKGKVGKLVGTSLHNFGMPFIRYVTGDVSSISLEGCSCGRGLPLMTDVTTKAEDIVVTKDGRFISPSVLTHPFKPLHSIQISQIVQEEIDHLLIKIVPREYFSDEDRDQLVSALRERVGSDINIEIQLVQEIPLTESGKFRWVISNVPLRF
ncbi:MAG: phenylacetate--CoA ligase family protein [Fervidobacterium sp.]